MKEMSYNTDCIAKTVISIYMQSCIKAVTMAIYVSTGCANEHRYYMSYDINKYIKISTMQK